MNEDSSVTVPETPPKAEGSELLTELPHEASYRPASPQERFAAFFADGLFFFYLLAGLGMVLKNLTHGDVAAPFSIKEDGLLLFVSSGAALYFLYYLLFEGVLTATPGKILGGLSIQKRKGGTPSLFAILIRNGFRLIDYPLFFLTGVGMIELTKKHQRLGDVIAGTVVMREISFEARRINPDTAQYAGATRRTLAFALDAVLIATFFYGILMLIPVSRTLVAWIGLNLVPTATLFYVTLSETLFQTTFGKVLFGMKVTQEDGRPARFSTLLIRNVFRLFDMNPGGYLCSFLSSRKQRPGDIAAGTIVLKDLKGFRGWLAIPYMLALAATAVYFGYQNPDSFVRRNLNVQIGPYRVDPMPAVVKRFTIRGLQIEDLEFGYGEEEVSHDKTFSAGQVIYLLFKISGYAVQSDRAWVQADIKVRDAHRNIILDRTNIINSSLPVEGRKTAKLVTRFAMHPQAPAGTYEVELTLRDMFVNHSTEETASFKVH